MQYCQSLAVVIVNWNCGANLRRCIDLLLAQSLMPNRVLVVDNGSNDNSLQSLPQKNPIVEVLSLGNNRGFAAANNAAFRRLGSFDWIALLNPDAFADPDWLQRLVEAAESNPDYACFASRMLKDKSPQILDGAGDAYHYTGLVWRRGYKVRAQDRHLQDEEVFSPCAAAALYRRDALVEVGGFDERFFCYIEDVDLGFRLRLLGHRCLYVSRAVVRHVGSATTGPNSDFTVYHGHRNLVWAFVKNMPAALFWLFLLPHILMNLIMILRYVPRGQSGAVLKAKLDAIRSLPAVWHQRRLIQNSRVASLGDLLKIMSFGWPRAERFRRD